MRISLGVISREPGRAALRRKRLICLCLFLASLASFAWSAKTVLDEHRDTANYVFDRAETRVALEAAALRLMSPALVEAKINEALEEGDIVLAQSYRHVAEDFGYPLSASTHQQLIEAETLRAALWRNSAKTAQGFVFGTGDSVPHLAGAMASDLVVYGDVRDVTIQTGRYFIGQEVDEFILALSGVGLALTAGTYATSGVAAPAKFWVSFIKLAKRSGSFSDRFATSLKNTVQAAMPLSTLRRNLANVPYWQRIQHVQPTLLRADLASAFGKSIDKPAIDALERVGNDLASISRSSGSPGAALKSLKLVDSPEDLSALNQLSDIAGIKTAAYADGFGKSLLYKTRYAFKTTAKLFLKYGWAMLSLMASITALLLIFVGERMVMRPVRGVVIRTLSVGSGSSA